MFQTEWLLRIAVSVILGSLIGYERYSRSKEAGVRTHAIVALASCLLMIVSEYAFPDAAKNDPARIAAQAVSGIGFLGAGIIFVQKGSIQGLTTAAGIWATAAVGLCTGAGMYILAIFSSLMMVVIQYVFPGIFTFNPPRNVLKLVVHLRSKGKVTDVNDILTRLRYNHSENTIRSDESDGWIIETEIISHRNIDPQMIKEEFGKNENIIEVRFQ